MMMAMSANGPPMKVAPRIRVLDSIHEDGLKLVEMPEDGVRALRRAMPGVRVVPSISPFRTLPLRSIPERLSPQAAA
jgi:hypothetical protein